MAIKLEMLEFLLQVSLIYRGLTRIDICYVLKLTVRL